MADITAAGVCGIVRFWHSCYICVWHLQGFEVQAGLKSGNIRRGKCVGCVEMWL